MLCGFNTNGLQSHRLDQALVLLHELGYEAVGLTLDVMHLDPLRATSSEVEDVAKQLRELELTPVIETGARFLLDPRNKHEPTLMSNDADARARRVDFYRRAAAIGRDLGAEVVSFWSGIDHAPSDDSWSRLCEGVAATCAGIRDRGLIPALEPEPGMAVGDLAAYERLRTATGSEAPDLTLDIGHVYVNESEPAPALIQRFAPFLRQVHLEDMKRGIHEHLVPGEGDVDFVADLAALSGVDFRGAVCFELSRSSHAAPSVLRTCRQIWDEAVVDRSRLP